MNHAGRKWIPLLGLLAMAGMVLFLAGNARAQQKTVQHHPAGPEQVEVQVNHGTVVMVEGNHLVLRREDGRLEALFIPESFRFHVEGRQVSVHELKPGMIITEEVVTRTKPMMVRTVEIHDGTVWNRVGNRVLIRNKTGAPPTSYTIPEWATIMVDGREETVHALRRDMKINATIITEEPFTEVREESKTHARHPSRAAAMPATREHQAELGNGEMGHNAQNGEMAEAGPAPREYAAEHAAQQLPRTASELPALALLGLLFLATAFGLRSWRSKL